MNRYSNYSTSQFQPLSLDEIMMIPMAKQANHDKLANDAAMLEQSDFNRLQGDDPISNQELDDYHNKVRKLSEDLYATGYNPHVANKLKELNKEYKYYIVNADRDVEQEVSLKKEMNKATSTLDNLSSKDKEKFILVVKYLLPANKGYNAESEMRKFSI